MLRFEYSSVIGAPVEVVFAFHEKPEALELLIPPGGGVRLVRREGGIRPGGVVELRLGAGPLHLRWLARHTAYERDRMFADEQAEGPFRRWHHRHEFLPENGGTRLRDSIEFSLPGGGVADLLFGWAVKRRLRRMFAFRHNVTRKICERMHREAIRRGGSPRPDPMSGSRTS